MFIFPVLLIECKMQQNMVMIALLQSLNYTSTIIMVCEWSVMCAHAFAHYDRSNCVSKSKVHYP